MVVVCQTLYAWDREGNDAFDIVLDMTGQHWRSPLFSGFLFQGDCQQWYL